MRSFDVITVTVNVIGSTSPGDSSLLGHLSKLAHPAFTGSALVTVVVVLLALLATPHDEEIDSSATSDDV